MFRQRLNELRLTIDLKPHGPLLVKAGEDPADFLASGPRRGQSGADSFRDMVQANRRDIEQRVQQEKGERDQRKEQRYQETGDARALREKLDLDMIFVTTLRNGQQEPYLPGSSLKGVWRSSAERLGLSWLPEEKAICNIFQDQQDDTARRSCTKQIERLPSSQRYAAACPICQIFGCGGLAGRLSVSDAYLHATPAFTYGQRSGVGINRWRGAAQEKALFFYQILEQGAFQVVITLENFELWQLGLLAHTWHPLWSGQAIFGYGSRRGLGRMQGVVREAVLTYFGPPPEVAPQQCQLIGVAALAQQRGMGDGYDFRAEPGEPATLPAAALQITVLRQAWTLPEPALNALWVAAAAAWQSVMIPAQEVPT